MSKSKTIWILIVVLIVVAAIYFWYGGYGEEWYPGTAINPPSGATVVTPDLGSDLYEQAQNPIKDQLPSTNNTVPNPLEGVYENPFK
ncbi:MAG: hypothetical protein AAB617_00855 [Patescibacteria group bacterium]